jgi:hypothetical protein
MRKVARTAAAVAVSVLLSSTLLTGCATDTGWLNGQPTLTASPAPATTPAAATPPATPTPMPSPEPAPSAALPHTILPLPGDCELSDVGTFSQVVTFVITSDDDTTPIEITYPGYLPDSAAPEARTVTAVGPVITILGSTCGDGPESEPWPFVATSTSGEHLSCSAFFGGKLIRSASYYAEGDTVNDLVADCTSHPGM